MYPKIKEFRSGYTVIDRSGCFYSVKLYINDLLHDKVICDSYRLAREYLKSFNLIAKNH